MAAHRLATPGTSCAAEGQGTRYRKAPSTSDAKRGRRATANRVLTILKAALNHAWKEGKAASDSAWRRVKPFREVAAANVRYLTAAECARDRQRVATPRTPGFAS